MANSTKRKVTKAVVEDLKPDSIVWDSQLAGFAVRCQRQAKVFIFKTRINKRQRCFTIGKCDQPWTIEQARDEVREIQVEIAKGKDPATKRDARKKILTFAECAARWLTEEVEPGRKPKTVVQYRHVIRLATLDLGNRLIEDITQRDIVALNSKHRAHQVQANRIMAVLSAFFAWTERHGLRPTQSNPTVGIPRHKEEKRKRYLSGDEIVRLGEALRDLEQAGDETPFVIAMIKLLIFTGARRSEIMQCKWDWVDIEKGQLSLPDSKTGAKEINLSAPALTVLSSLARIDGNPFVICGTKPGQHLVNIAAPWQRICKRAGLVDLRLHDLRHTYASIGVSGGASLPMIGGLLGHANTSTTERYAHLQTDPVRAVNEKIGETLASMIGGQTGNVVSIDHKAGAA